MRVNIYLLTLVFIGSPCFGASFDCQKALSAVEKAICASIELEKLDEEMAEAYSKLRGTFPSYIQKNLTYDQRKWLKHRDSVCKAGGYECLEHQYQQRINRLNNYLKVKSSGIDFSGNDSIISVSRDLAIFTDEVGNTYPDFIQYPNTKTSVLRQLVSHPFQIGFSPYNTYEQHLHLIKDDGEIEVSTCSQYAESIENGYKLGRIPGPYRAVVNYLAGCRNAYKLANPEPKP